MSVTVLYFARLREQLDCEQETLELDQGNAAVEDVLNKITARGGRWQEAFADKFIVAVNQEVANRQTPVKGGDEVAFYPPVTGG